MYDFCAFLTALEKIGQKKLVYTALLMYLTILLLSKSVPLHAVESLRHFYQRVLT